jgi:DNA polymerase/3'-5' exonuclease PolX
MNLNQVKGHADNILLRLYPYTERIHIAGSIRREKPEVKDIEIVCMPRFVDGGQTALFSETIAEKVISKNYVDVVKTLGKVIKGKPDGRYMQIELPQRINLDLFMPDPDDYYRQYAIRTGSSDYSRQTIAKGWKRKGWCGSDLGLRRIVDCEEEFDPLTNKPRWICVNPNGERPPVWNSEQEFFAWIDVPFISPKHRKI